MAAHWVTLTWCVATWTLLDIPDETEDLIRTLDSADASCFSHPPPVPVWYQHCCSACSVHET